MNGLDHYYNKFTSEDLIEMLSFSSEELPISHRNEIEKILKQREDLKDSKSQNKNG